MNEKAKLSLTAAVFVLWAGTVVVSWFRPDYRMPVSLHIVASLVIGGVFAGGAFEALKFKIGEAELEARTRDDRGDHDDPPGARGDDHGDELGP